VITKDHLKAEIAQNEIKLSTGWQLVKLADIAYEVSDRVENPSQSGLAHFVGLEHLESGSLTVRQWGDTDDVTSAMKLFKNGDTLFARRNAYLKRASMATFDGVCSGDATVLREKREMIVEGFLPMILNTEDVWNYAIANAAGSMSKRVKWHNLAEYKFALPPKDEQQRIADILWAAEREKLALLYVIESIQKLIHSVGIETFKISSKSQVLLRELISKGLLEFQTGPFGTVLKASSYVSKGTPIINPVNILDGKLITSDGPFLSDDECNRLSRYKMQEGDIVLGRKGDMSKIVHVTKEYEGFIIGSDCIRIRLKSNDIQSRFLYYFLVSPQTNMWLARHASGTTMPGLNEKILAALELTVPIIAVQQEVVRIFHSLDDALKALKLKLEANASLMKTLTNQLLSSQLAKVSAI
jgi:type I restriction enzyme, S subunit